MPKQHRPSVWQKWAVCRCVLGTAHISAPIAGRGNTRQRTVLEWVARSRRQLGCGGVTARRAEVSLPRGGRSQQCRLVCSTLQVGRRTVTLDTGLKPARVARSDLPPECIIGSTRQDGAHVQRKPGASLLADGAAVGDGVFDCCAGGAGGVAGLLRCSALEGAVQAGAVQPAQRGVRCRGCGVALAGVPSVLAPRSAFAFPSCPTTPVDGGVDSTFQTCICITSLQPSSVSPLLPPMPPCRAGQLLEGDVVQVFLEAVGTPEGDFLVSGVQASVFPAGEASQLKGSRHRSRALRLRGSGRRPGLPSAAPLPPCSSSAARCPPTPPRAGGGAAAPRGGVERVGRKVCQGGGGERCAG